MFQRLERIIKSIFKKKSYALNQLDCKLLPYINFKNGFFVEAGANDGISQSNTFYFEKYRGWKGLLIEAIPALAGKCLQNRPECIVENCALVASDYREKSIDMTYCNLMSITKGAHNNIESELNHINSGKRYLTEGEETYTVTVPAATLSSVLDKYQIKDADFLSLDVEGYETQVLKGINFNRHLFKYILVEVRNRNDIDAVIQHYYKPIAILNITETYEDILYQRR
jgi:FkbM family methyltransferase